MANEEELDNEATVESELYDVPDDQVDDIFNGLDNLNEEQDNGLQEEEQETEDEVEDNSEAPESSSETSEEPEDTQASLNYEEEYKKLLQPFRANGRDMQVDSIEDARTLMQMGANYNKKMAALKPNLKLVKLLEKNDLLDESKLSFLIDLQNKNPEAISKFIKDTGLDPLEIDTDRAEQYIPKVYTVSDREVELDEILNEIRDTESFSTTAEIISNRWDATSKKVLYENPRLIQLLNDHVSSGVYDHITNIVEKERILGRLGGVSDIEAYKLVGDALNASGTGVPVSKDKQPTKATKSGQSLANRKKAAGSTKSTSKTPQNSDINPLALSDEEFEKLINSKFI